LGGTKYDVKSRKEMLLKICEVVAAKHKEDFEMVLTLSGPNKEYFSTNPYELLTCEKISGTEMYVDVNLSAMGAVALTHRVLSLFGYEEKDLSVETK
ncbi:MAG: restriction endonuclease subunit R, partial [Deltaproteobacteria bacterium]